MEDNTIYLDSKFYNIRERMFGSRDLIFGKVKYRGDSLLNLTDGNIYTCCGVFGRYLGLINDLGETVFAKPVSDWKTGCKRIAKHAYIEIEEDFTRDKLLHKIVCEEKEILPAPSEPPEGIFFPAMLICDLSGKHKTIPVYPQATPENIEYQCQELLRLVEKFKLKSRIEKSLADIDILPEEADGQSALQKTGLQELREERGMSLSELAQTSGVSRGIIKKYELPENDIKKAKGEVLLALSKALNCTIEELLS